MANTVDCCLAILVSDSARLAFVRPACSPKLDCSTVREPKIPFYSVHIILLNIAALCTLKNLKNRSIMLENNAKIILY